MDIVEIPKQSTKTQHFYKIKEICHLQIRGKVANMEHVTSRLGLAHI